MRRKTYEEVRLIFESRGCLLHSKEYVNAHQKLQYTCRCGNVSETTLNHFSKGHFCSKCGGSERLTYEYVKNFFMEQGCTLLSTEYVNGLGKLSYLCSCGTSANITWNDFRSGSRCNECKSRKISQSRSLSFERIKPFIESYGYTVLSNTCSGAKDKIDVICPKGHSTQIVWADFKRGRRCGVCNKERLHLRGELHPFWKPEKTGEERIRQRSSIKNRQWRASVYERDNYTCQICNIRGKTLNAHHMDAYHAFPDTRYDVNNGVTLCKICHDDFHRIYGRRNNTRQQFDEYLFLRKTQLQMASNE